MAHLRRALCVLAWMSCALTACAPVPPEGNVYRRLDAPIGVTSRFDPERMSGEWFLRGRLPPDADVLTVNFKTLGALPTMVTSLADGEVLRTTVWRGEERQPGRYVFRTDRSDAVRDLVVIWIDESHRTAAIADPAGRFAWILDRAPAGGVDRIEAATRILEFSGFDEADLQIRL